jgi:arylsulfatase A-like enzyme
MLTRRAALAGLALPLAKAQPKGPNILLLHTDDQTWNTIRAWGNPEIQTPNLDKLAARGLSFRNCYNQGGHVPAVCIASRAMLLSGKSLFRATATNGLETPLLPEFFREKGYDTFFTGKWHLGAPLLQRAYQNGGLVHLGGMGPQINPPLSQFPNTEKATIEGRATILFANSCHGFLKSRKNQQNPFFAYCAFTAPHDPREAAHLAQQLYGNRDLTLPRPWFEKPTRDNGELTIRDEMVVPAPRSRVQTEKELRDYYALITEIDTNIGNLLNTLEQQSQLKDTVVAFCSDNGLAMGAHGLMGKQSMYEHSLKIPLILAGPGVRPGTENSPIFLYELYTRLAKLARLAPPPHAEVSGPLYFAYRDFQRSLRLGDRKMSWAKHPKGLTIEQYNIAIDPFEENNLHGTSQAFPQADFQRALTNARTHYADPHPDFLA